MRCIERKLSGTSDLKQTTRLKPDRDKKDAREIAVETSHQTPALDEMKFRHRKLPAMSKKNMLGLVESTSIQLTELEKLLSSSFDKTKALALIDKLEAAFLQVETSEKDPKKPKKKQSG